MRRVLNVFGTRPEAIKMAPVVRALAACNAFESKVCVTAQHRQMLDQVLALFDIQPDFDLDLMVPGQSLADLLGRVLHGMQDVYAHWRPDIVLVHGDTTTTLGAGLSACYAGIPVGHVEAGLRTHDKWSPWPEETNRHLTGVLADLHFAPTAQARANLLAEGVDEGRIHVTGNTVVDALQGTVRHLAKDAALRARMDAQFGFLPEDRHVVLVTLHRRENFGVGLDAVCDALLALSQRRDVLIVFPVHPNPRVRGPIHRRLGHCANIRLLDPLGYLPFVYLMHRSRLVMTDSGGVQEEAPSLNKPVLVLRTATERPEVLDTGLIRLVGTVPSRIVAEANRVLDVAAPEAALNAAADICSNPCGDGHAAERICSVLLTDSEVFHA